MTHIPEESPNFKNQVQEIKFGSSDSIEVKDKNFDKESSNKSEKTIEEMVFKFDTQDILAEERREHELIDQEFLMHDTPNNLYYWLRLK